ncbi:hypothetical protein BVRB_5g115200 [Beta vulgaris subsp. vulgaris]|nr:hypothetical protein BVRB_5g115200 [Beta vulgaris subsp. vulgaris]
MQEFASSSLIQASFVFNETKNSDMLCESQDIPVELLSPCQPTLHCQE